MFAELNKAHKAILAHPGHDGSKPFKPDHDQSMKDYWTMVKKFKSQLLEKLYDKNFIRMMNRKQLLQFVAWCSSYRPTQPHIILTCLSRAVEE